VIVVEAPDAGAPPGPADPERAAAAGWIQINCRPWAEVTLDGKRIGTTPINRRRASAGAHRLVLENGALGYREELAVKVVAGQTAHVNRSAAAARPGPR
jgi:serine/threonine-protein kinase